MLEQSTRFLTAAMQDWFVKALRAAVIIVGGATIFEIWGIEVLPLIAGLGLFGVAVALGAQDMFKNLKSPITIADGDNETGKKKSLCLKAAGVISGTLCVRSGMRDFWVLILQRS